MPIVAVGAAALAIVLLLIYLAGQRLYITPFQGIGNAGGTVGGLILRWFGSGIAWAIDHALGDIRAGIRGVEGLMIWPAYWAKTHLDAVTHTLYQGYLVSRRIIATTIPNAVGQALYTAHQWVDAAALAAAAEDNAIISWASGAFRSVYATLGTDIASAEQYAATLANNVEKFAAAGIAADAVYAGKLYNSAITYTDGLIHGVEGWVTGEIGNVTAWAGGEFVTLQKYIASVQAASMAFTLTQVATVEGELGKLERECTNNLCSGVGGLASLFNALTGDLGIAGLIALAAAAASDPKGTARVINDGFGPVAREGAHVMQAACGL